MLKYVIIGVLFVRVIFWSNTMAETQGHIENFNGVDINFSPPNLHEKQSFQLRGVLTTYETKVVADAMPEIAKFLNYIGRKDAVSKYGANLTRKPYEFIDRKDISLAVSRTHGWSISGNAIKFMTDYIVSYGEVGNAEIGDYLFRDAYIFKKIDDKWSFAENYGTKPYGFLKCKRADKKCTADADLW
jgi:hypothetical protein